MEKKTTYYIDYGTGAGNEHICGTLEEAEQIADEGAAYTQTSIRILDESGNEVARRQWYGVDFANEVELYENGEDADVIKFGSSGYYDEWQEN